MGTNCKNIFERELEEKRREERQSLIRLMNLRLVAGGWDLSLQYTLGKRPQTHSSRLGLITEWSHLSKSKCCSRLYTERQGDGDRGRQKDSLEDRG